MTDSDNLSDLLRSLGLDSIGEPELLRSLGVDRIRHTELSTGVAIRMWFREWTAEIYVNSDELARIAPSNRRAYVAAALVRLANDVRAMGHDGWGADGSGFKFQPAASLLDPMKVMNVPLEPARRVVKTPSGYVDVDPPRDVTLVSDVLDEIADAIRRRCSYDTRRWDTAFSQEPDAEYQQRLMTMVGETIFAELWNEAADKVDPPKPYVSRFEAVVAELDEPEKKP